VLPRKRLRWHQFRIETHRDENDGFTHELKIEVNSKISLISAQRATDEITSCTPWQKKVDTQLARASSMGVSLDSERSSTPGGSSSSRANVITRLLCRLELKTYQGVRHEVLAVTRLLKLECTLVELTLLSSASKAGTVTFGDSSIGPLRRRGNSGTTSRTIPTTLACSLKSFDF